MNGKQGYAADVIGVLGGALLLGLFAFALPIAAVAAVVGIPSYIAWRIYLYQNTTPAALERQSREHLDTLYEQAQGHKGLSEDAFVKHVMAQVARGSLDDAVHTALMAVACDVHTQEMLDVPPPPPVARSVAGARYQKLLAARPDPRQAVAALADAFRRFIALLPSADSRPGIPFGVPLADLMTAEHVNALIFPLFEADGTATLRTVGTQIERNVARTATRQGGHGLLPSEYRGDQPIGDVYLQGTPFAHLLGVVLTRSIPTETRYSHTHIVGATGTGKTQLIQSLIARDLDDETRPSIVVLDPHGDMIRAVSCLSCFADDPDRLILIDPRDMDYPPAINLFDVNRDRLGRYGQVEREQIVAGVIQTFDYFFSGLLGADLTAKQGGYFRYIIRLMLALPDTFGRPATIMDILRLLEDPAPYEPAIAKLPENQRHFFATDFRAKGFNETKEQVRYRLNNVLENPTMARLFTSPRTKLDLFTALNEGSVILIDASKDFLKGASSHFGRLFIALLLQAVFERAVIPPNRRHPVHLYVDEASDFFDDTIDDFLTETRKYRCAGHFAHQNLGQAAPELRASFAANTAIKFAAGGSHADAKALAPDMRTTPEFILEQPRLHFACYARGAISSAVSFPVHAGLLERMPRMTDGEWHTLRDRIRERICLPREPDVVPQPAQPAPSADLDTIDTSAR